MKLEPSGMNLDVHLVEHQTTERCWIRTMNDALLMPCFSRWAGETTETCQGL